MVTGLEFGGYGVENSRDIPALAFIERSRVSCDSSKLVIFDTFMKFMHRSTFNKKETRILLPPVC